MRPVRLEQPPLAHCPPRGGAALRRDGRGAIGRMLLRQALLGRQRARFQLGQNQTGGVVAIAGVAGIKAGL